MVPSERKFCIAIISNSHTYSNGNIRGSFEYLEKRILILLHSAENVIHFSCSLCTPNNTNAVFYQPMTQSCILIFLSVITNFRFNFW